MSLRLIELITYMKDCHKHLNKVPTAMEFRGYLKDLKVIGNPYRLFAHNYILEKAGIIAKKTWRLTDKEIQDNLKMCECLLLSLSKSMSGETPKQNEFIQYCHSQGFFFAWTHYISYNEMLKKVNLKPNQNSYTTEVLKQLLFDNITKHGKVPSQLELENDKTMPM
jgi:hypothetical protein